MNIYFFVLITCWKSLICNVADISGILHGIVCGMFLYKLDLIRIVLIIVVPGIVICGLLLYKNRTLSDREKTRILESYMVNVFMYTMFVDSLVTSNTFGIIMYSVILGLAYLVIPLGVAFYIGRHGYVTSRFEPNRQLNVSSDYSEMPSSFQSEEVIQSENTTCVICLEPLDTDNVKLNNCSHVFHMACITEWLIRKRECPMCRQSSRPIENIV